MENISFRPLKADEIECKVSCVRGNGLKVMLWKNNLATKTILDETVGEMGWQTRRSAENECTIDIWDEDKKTWVSKSDYGDVEKDKPEYVKRLAADAMKRAGTAWGIGTELYTLPSGVNMLWFKETEAHVYRDVESTDVDDKGNDVPVYSEWKESDNFFRVLDVEYDENKNITYIKICNDYKVDGNKKQAIKEFGVKSTTETPVAKPIAEKKPVSTPAKKVVAEEKTVKEDKKEVENEEKNKIEEVRNDNGSVVPFEDLEHKKITELEAKALRDALVREGVPEDYILKAFKVESLTDLNYKMFSHINCKMDKIKAAYKNSAS